MKYFLIFISLFSAGTLFAQDTQKCLDKSKAFFEQKEFPYAQRTLEDCLKTNPNDVDILVSLGGVCMKQNDFDNALTYFKTALKNMTKQSPYVSYVYTRMGDCYTHKKDFEKAGKYYEASLKYEPANINSLVGKGICEEQTGNYQNAEEYFKKALAVDFTNIVARRRLIALEPDILTQDELVANMKERNILDPQASTYQEQDLDLLKKMLKAERDKAIKYLEDKYDGKIPPGLIVEKYPGKIYARKMLSYSGYNDLMFLLSQDAINFFLKEQVYKSEMLKLRDLEGNKIFNDKGFLTEEGLIAYSLSLNGQKSYLLPSQPLPSGVQKANMFVQQLLKQGYEEITVSEYAYLMEESRCSKQTLVNKLGVKIVPITKEKNRFLVLIPPQMLKITEIPYIIVQEKRKKKIESPDTTPVYKTTFGTGNTRPYICKPDGTLDSMEDITVTVNKEK
jgi:Cytochrome c biogenesis factor